MSIEVGRDDVRRLLAEGAQLVEVLPAGEFEEERLPGAVNIPLRELGDRASELDRSRPLKAAGKANWGAASLSLEGRAGPRALEAACQCTPDLRS